MSEPIPSPGSPSARSQGCKCDPRKNNRGEGAVVINGVARFWVDPNCKLHNTEKTN